MSKKYMIDLMERAFCNASHKGFWERRVAPGARVFAKCEMIALEHSELSERLEAVRKPQESEKIPGFSLEEEEIADLFIRWADYAVGWYEPNRILEAIEAKMAYNATRPHMHGKEN